MPHKVLQPPSEIFLAHFQTQQPSVHFLLPNGYKNCTQPLIMLKLTKDDTIHQKIIVTLYKLYRHFSQRRGFTM